MDRLGWAQAHHTGGSQGSGSGGGGDDSGDLLRKIRQLGDRDVLALGQIPREIVEQWTSEIEGNLDVVLTGRQRGHYLDRHPEMIDYEDRIQRVVLDPDEVHRNRRDKQIALFYKRVDEDRYLRATVVMQARSGRFKHSIITCRLASSTEVRRGVGRRAWEIKRIAIWWDCHPHISCNAVQARSRQVISTPDCYKVDYTSDCPRLTICIADRTV